MFEIVAVYPTRLHINYGKKPTTKDIVLFTNIETEEEAATMLLSAAAYFDLPSDSLKIKEY